MRIRTLKMTLRLRTLMVLVAVAAVAMTAASMFWESPSAEFRKGYAQGRLEADQQLNAGLVTLYTYGMLLPRDSYYDKGTGLTLEPIAGCLVDEQTEGRAQGHNDRIREYMNAGKVPANSHKNWTDDLNHLIRTYTRQAQQQEPVRLTAGGPAARSPDGRFQVSISRPTTESSGRSSSMCELVIVQPDGSKKSTFCVEGQTQNSLVWGPKNSCFALLETKSADKTVVVQALDLKMGCWLCTETSKDGKIQPAPMDRLLSADDF